MIKISDLVKGNGLVLILLFSTTIQAAETDQFYATKAVIKDSSLEMNSFFHKKIEIGLIKSNHESEAVTCREVAAEVLTQVLGEFSLKDYAKNKTFSQVSFFTQQSPLIDRFPNETMSESDYRADSIYRKRPFPVNAVGIGRTININGIYIGTDKIGHFSIVGRTYYKNFLKGLSKGLTLDQAQEMAVLEGFKQEIAILGYRIGGTFSYADLEANYQGLQFARNMCEGKNPHLIQVNGEWIHNPINQFDIKNYINPKMDEAFNVSFWSPRMWRIMKDDITKAYCLNKSGLEFQARVGNYTELLKETANDQFIARFVKENPKFDRSKQLLNNNINCDE